MKNLYIEEESIAMESYSIFLIIVAIIYIGVAFIFLSTISRKMASRQFFFAVRNLLDELFFVVGQSKNGNLNYSMCDKSISDNPLIIKEAIQRIEIVYNSLINETNNKEIKSSTYIGSRQGFFAHFARKLKQDPVK
jgi:hypothetical protein